jgi:hypothetical protein
MKTAMQELIDELDFFKNILWKEDSKNESILVKDIIRKAVLKLEKEKEQMIVFGKKMQLVQHVSYDDDITYCFEPEEYYNQTYNQNEI